MKIDRIELLDQIFANPKKYLGTIERNTEIKVVYLILQALGWNTVEDIALAFQIPRKKVGEIAKAAHAVDFAVRDAVGLCALGETKQWFIRDKEWAVAVNQIKRYQTAVHAPRTFLSRGWRGVIFDVSGKEIYQVEEKSKVTALIEKLKPLLGKGCIPNQLSDESIWEYGLCPSPQRAQ